MGSDFPPLTQPKEYLSSTIARSPRVLLQKYRNFPASIFGGHYNSRGHWRSIYLGLAGLGGDSYCLRSRLLEELMDEHSCLWRICRSQKDILEARKSGRGGRKRAMRKEGSTHII